MTFSWPITAPTQTVTVRDADIGNTLTYESHMEVRNNRGQNSKTVYEDWPINKIQHFQLNTITGTLMQELRTFFIASAGDEIYLTDHNSDIWLGIITTPILEIFTQRDACSYSVEFDFIGETS